MVYRIPLIEGVPLITAKPYLAMDGHKGQVQSLSMCSNGCAIITVRIWSYVYYVCQLYCMICGFSSFNAVFNFVLRNVATVLLAGEKPL